MEPFKNNFSLQLVACIAGHLQKHVASFDRDTFEAPIRRDLEKLELKERSQLIADHVHLALPIDHQERSRILLAMLHPDDENHANQQSDEQGICGWGTSPLTTVVGQHGLDDFEGSLRLLKEMTKRFSSEFDIRYFLLADQERALNIIFSWLDDPNTHVRRLASEGTRPRLPWGMQLPQLKVNPRPALPILEALRDDKEEYVRRSVANHLNDIAKDHPDLVANMAVDWMQGANNERVKLVRHACRTLIKQGHTIALKAVGVRVPDIEFHGLSVESSTVEFGNALIFSVELRSTSDGPQSLLIDYVVHFRKANGRLTDKVFKWKQVTLHSGEFLAAKRSHAIRPITTRRYYNGQHALSLRINGQDFGFTEFDLVGVQEGSMPPNTP